MKKALVVALFVLLAQTAFAAGTLTYTSFFSQSLQENRELGVYLPEGYNPDDQVRYPVIYFLHGAYANETSYWSILKPKLDNMIAGGQLRPVIVVAPDGSGGEFGGAFWVNSVLYGLFEDYVAFDVVNFVDATYLTIAEHQQRAIMGHSDGGDGAMVLGLLHADVFGALAAHSGYFNWERARELLRDCTLAENSGPPYHFTPSAGQCTEAVFRVGGAYSPNLDNPPYFVDFLYDEEGNVVESVLDRWKLYNADVLASAILPGSYPGIYFDCGTLDALNYPGNLDLEAALGEMGIPFEFWSYVGGHSLTATRLQHSFTFLNEVFPGPEGVEVEGMSVGYEPRLYANQPNPVQNSAIIRFRTPASGVATLRVLDGSGRALDTIMNWDVTAGVHTVTWRPRNLPAGVYFFDLRTREGQTSRKMVVAR